MLRQRCSIHVCRAGDARGSWRSESEEGWNEVSLHWAVVQLSLAGQAAGLAASLPIGWREMVDERNFILTLSTPELNIGLRSYNLL